MKAIGENVIATDMELGETVTAGGIVIQDTIGKMNSENKARWFTVSSIGDRSIWKNELKAGDRILVDWGRWTENVEVDGVKYWKIDPNGIAAIEE